MNWRYIYILNYSQRVVLQEMIGNLINFLKKSFGMNQDKVKDRQSNSRKGQLPNPYSEETHEASRKACTIGAVFGKKKRNMHSTAT